MIKLEFLFLALIILVVGITIWKHSKVPSTIDGQKVIPTKVDYHTTRSDKELDGKIVIEHVPSGDKLRIDHYDGNFLYPNGDVEFPKDKNGLVLWKVEPTRDRYFVDFNFDVGAYAGVVDGHKTSNKTSDTDVGIRYSPLRIGYGLFAPDALVSRQSAGIGISCYPSPDNWGKYWRHVGIGYGKVYTYEDMKLRNLFYLSFSTRF